MTKAVLFLLLVSNSPRPATWTADFTTMQACQAAGEQLRESFKGEGRVTFKCVEK